MAVKTKTESRVQTVRRLQAGLRFGAIEQLRTWLDLSLEEICVIVRISPRTLARRKREGRFSLDESERIHRVGSLFHRAVELFEGNAPAARRWLATPRPAFDGTSALQFAQTDLGAREVEDTIERIEYGVIS